MPKAKICPECLSSDLADENINGHTTLICTGCGVVVDESDISENPDSVPLFVNNTNINELARNRKVSCLASGISKTKLKWSEDVKTLCRQLKLNGQMEKQAVNFFHEAFNMKEFNKRQREQKRALCGACVYLTCRTNNLPVTIDYIIYICSVDRESLVASFKKLVRLLGLTIDVVKLEDIIPACLQQKGLGNLKLEEQVKKIIILSQEAWLATGRNPTILIIAAAYVAWRAIPENFKKKMNNFFQMTSINTATCKMRIKEIEDVLFKLACKIPWKSADTVNCNLVGLYVDDIMKYKVSLFSQFQFHDDEEDDDGEDLVFEMEDDPKLVSESPELTDLDLPESEMHIYLKSEQEILSEKIHFDNPFEEDLVPKQMKTIEERALLKRKHDDCVEEE